MKKILCAVLAAMMVLIPSSLVFAAGDKLPELIVSAKERLDIPDEYSEFESSVVSGEGYDSYSLRWSDEDTNTISAEINDYGDITYYHRYSGRYGNKKGMTPFSTEELSARCGEFLEKVNPGWVPELKKDESGRLDINSDYYTQVYKRAVNGIELFSSTVSVTVNKYTGEAETLYSDWVYFDKTDDPASAISEKDAKDAFSSLSGFDLKYIKKGDKDEAGLVYYPKNSSLLIDALTGEEADFSSHSSARKESLAAADMKNDAGGSGAYLSPAERAEIENMQGLISKEKAIETAKGLKNTYFSEFKATGASYYKEEERYFVNVQFDTVQEKPEEYFYGSVTLDARTGELISFYSYKNPENDKKASLSEKLLEDKAETFLKQYAPDCFKKSALFDQDSEGYYTYNQSVNGIKYDSNYMTVSVNSKTGKIESYYKSWKDNISFDSAEGIITAEEAAEKIFEKSGFSMTYRAIRDNYLTPTSIKLCYGLENRINLLDAKTGEPVNFDFEVQKEDGEEPYFSDISGHYAEEYIKKLVLNGVIEPEEAFRPDEALTQKEALIMTAKLTDVYVPYPIVYNELFKRMERNDIIDAEDKDENALVDRKNAVKIIIRALGYKDVAELKGIFKTSFADSAAINEDFLGYTALAEGFGIVRGDNNGNFNPDDTVSRADFAIMIYNYLN